MRYVLHLHITPDSQKVWENSEKWPKVAAIADFWAKTAHFCTNLHGTSIAHFDHTAMSKIENMISNDTSRRVAEHEVTNA